MCFVFVSNVLMLAVVCCCCFALCCVMCVCWCLSVFFSHAKDVEWCINGRTCATNLQHMLMCYFCVFFFRGVLVAVCLDVLCL